MEEHAAEVTAHREPFFKLPAPIWGLLAIMVAVHVYVNFQNASEQFRLVLEFGSVPSHYSGPTAPQFQSAPLSMWWPFVTHLFLHGNFAHIAFNSLWLMAVGTPLARRLGTFPFLGFYFVCGVLSAFAHILGNLGSDTPVIGASGAIAGCMAGAVRVIYSPDARYFSTRDVRVGSLASLWDMRVIVVTIAWMAINLLMGSGLVPIPGAEGAHIAWEAHVGRFLAGLVLLPLFDWLAGRGTPAFPHTPS